MEKLSIEEKAKAYDEALERARKFATDLPNGRNDRLYHVWDLESIFPELKVSEDERIRKELIFYLGDMPEDTELRNGVTNRDVLVWLEKQGEQILANSAQTCKIENYQEEGWYSSGDDEYICGISFDEPIKLPVEFYYTSKEE